MKIEVSQKKEKRWNQHWMSQKMISNPRISSKTYEATWGKLPHNRSESIGFSLAISRHFLIATLPGTNELPLNMDGWNTRLSEKGFQLFFRGKLLVSAREKNTSLSTSQNRTWLPNIMCNWIDYNTSSKGTKKYRVSKTCSKHKFQKLFHHYQLPVVSTHPLSPCLRPSWVSITSES